VTFKQYFDQFGEIEECILMQDKTTNRSRGFGFVTYKDISSVKKIYQITNHVIDNKNVECKTAIPKEQLLPLDQTPILNMINATLKNKDNSMIIVNNTHFTNNKNNLINNNDNLNTNNNQLNQEDYPVTYWPNSKKIFVGGLPNNVTERNNK